MNRRSICFVKAYGFNSLIIGVSAIIHFTYPHQTLKKYLAVILWLKCPYKQ